LAILLHGSYRLPVLRILTATWFRASSALALAAAWVWMLAGSALSTGTLVESVLLPAILVSVISWPASRLFRILEWASLRWMGRISYGLYLWQQLLFTPPRSPSLYAAIEAFLPRLILTFAAATLSYYLLERPLMTYGRTVSSRFQRASWATLSQEIPQVSWNNEPDAQDAERHPRLRQEI
jgi:peptidoglycan/LPS O-acetylase OafA/YrhL